MKKKHHKDGMKHHSDKAVSHGTSENEGRAWGHGEYANMPKEVVMASYPKGGYSTDPHLDDTIQRLDSDSMDAEHIVMRQKHRSMY